MLGLPIDNTPYKVIHSLEYAEHEGYAAMIGGHTHHRYCDISACSSGLVFFGFAVLMVRDHLSAAVMKVWQPATLSGRSASMSKEEEGLSSRSFAA